MASPCLPVNVVTALLLLKRRMLSNELNVATGAVMIVKDNAAADSVAPNLA